MEFLCESVHESKSRQGNNDRGQTLLTERGEAPKARKFSMFTNGETFTVQGIAEEGQSCDTLMGDVI